MEKRQHKLELNRERQQAYRERQKKKGRKQRQIYLNNEEFHAVKLFISRLRGEE